LERSSGSEPGSCAGTDAAWRGAQLAESTECDAFRHGLPPPHQFGDRSLMAGAVRERARGGATRSLTDIRMRNGPLWRRIFAMTN
jgi:hypothetical protein